MQLIIDPNQCGMRLLMASDVISEGCSVPLSESPAEMAAEPPQR
jgi:hypothetical protein